MFYRFKHYILGLNIILYSIGLHIKLILGFNNIIFKNNVNLFKINNLFCKTSTGVMHWMGRLRKRPKKFHVSC